MQVAKSMNSAEQARTSQSTRDSLCATAVDEHTNDSSASTVRHSPPMHPPSYPHDIVGSSATRNAIYVAFDVEEVSAWAPDNFEIVRKLQDATRNHGEVFLMRDITVDELVAVKKMPTAWTCHSREAFLATYWYEHEQPWQDIGCMKYLDDCCFKYSCKLKGVYRDGSDTYVVTSFCDHGDMFNWSRSLVATGVEREVIVRPIAKQILEAVMLLHNLSIVHLDLSLENILLTSLEGLDSMSVRLIDFGQSETSRLLYRNVNRGKPTYQAPEMHTDEVYDGFLTDVFALGVTLFSLMTNEHPWRSTEPGECKCFTYVKKRGLRAYLAKRRLRDHSGTVADFLSEPFMQLLDGMLALSPCDRLTLGEHACEGFGKTSVWDKPWLNADPRVITMN